MNRLSNCLFACALLALPALTACGDSTVTGLGPHCGDGVCASNETPESCTEDCSLECVPDTTRCQGNVLVTCLEDGLHEDANACDSGQVCQLDACVDAPEVPESDAGTDTATDAQADSSADGEAGTDVQEDLVPDGDPEDVGGGE